MSRAMKRMIGRARPTAKRMGGAAPIVPTWENVWLAWNATDNTIDHSALEPDPTTSHSRACVAMAPNKQGVWVAYDPHVPALWGAGATDSIKFNARWNGDGVLVEPTRDNLHAKADKPDQWAYSSVTPTAAPGITGALENRLFTDSGGAIESGYQVGNTVAADTADYTYSVFVAKGTGVCEFEFELRIDGTTVRSTVQLDKATGAIAERSTSENGHRVKAYGNWWRLEITLTNQGNTQWIVRSRYATSWGQYDAAATGTTTLSAAQVEQGSFATSPIFTDSAAAQRVQTSLSLKEVSALPAEGVVLCEVASPRGALKSGARLGPNMITNLGTYEVYWGAFNGGTVYSGVIPNFAIGLDDIAEIITVLRYSTLTGELQVGVRKDGVWYWGDVATGLTSIGLFSPPPADTTRLSNGVGNQEAQIIKNWLPLNNIKSVYEIEEEFADAAYFAAKANSFIFEVTTTTASESVKIPALGNETYDVTIKWGDGAETAATASSDPGFIHTYGPAGTYEIRISGTAPRFLFQIIGINTQITAVRNLGATGLTSMEAMFKDCTNLTVVEQNGNVDTSGVTSMYFAFRGCTAMTTAPDVSSWDTSSVTTMRQMFLNCTAMATTPDVSNWDTSSVTSMLYMFAYCRDMTAPPDVSSWDTSSATDLGQLFRSCEAMTAPPDVSSWDTSSATNVNGTFVWCEAVTAAPDISGWDLSAVTDGGDIMQGIGTPMDTATYDAFLINAASQTVQSGVSWHFGGAQYTPGGAAEAARSDLVNNDSWTITDGGAA
uniref:PKD domain-containing protein n=1 Tax=Magnetococcus massalia (strain MO-1) TaxID=451514 RepID=A0A1S7LI07_MAGMO|nr:Exported protein of unknown function. Putative lipoproteins, bacterial surface protein [Candidatus Magnetococcus massalia]